METMIDNDLRLLTISLVKSFQPLGLFHDKYFEKIILQYYFLDIQHHIFNVHMRKIQIKLTSVNKKIAYHVNNMFLKIPIIF
jgi:hypothetical protein